MDDALRDLARHAGIADTYRDVTGQQRDTAPETARALLAAMGLPADSARVAAETLSALRARDGAADLPPFVVSRAGAPPPLHPARDWRLTGEEGAVREGRGALPPLAAGRYLLDTGGTRSWILSAPPVLPLPPRGWGVTLPLYGLRGPARGGLGTYEDLEQAARGLGARGAAFLGINPVHAGFFAAPGLISPYSPSHRRMLSVAHVAPRSEPAARDGGGLIDHESALAARRAALETEFAGFRDADGAFAAFRAARGPGLERFATYEALSEEHGPHWTGWPVPLRDPGHPEVARAARRLAHRVAFHAWLQFRADGQLGGAAQAARAAGMTHGLYLDLAVGTHPDGAETWADPEAFARGVSLGAPPDAFAKDGQNWSLAPFNPQGLVETGFAALAGTLAAQLRHAGMLRIDHVLGFERAFWVPEGAPGAYVAMPRDAMLAVTRIEAARAGAVIVGEDLGNTPDGLREALAKSGLLGCSVAQFSPGGAGTDARRLSLASFGTHDLPTWRGWRAGADLRARADLGHLEQDALAAAEQARARDVAEFDAGLGGGVADLDAMHRALGASEARLVALQAEDILEITDQPNLPGTVDDYPNWRRRLPVDAADLGEDPRMVRAAGIMASTGR